MRSLCLLCLSVFATACTESAVVTRDASLLDAGASSDAGAHSDASVHMDAATKDASSASDGAALDANVRDDSGAPDFCRLPPESGNCDAYFERYAFNPKTQACELFVYGGCGGNANNFERPLDCLAACVSGGDGGAQKAGCKIGDQAFASGTTGIKDPHSCNTCSCDDGQLSCTEIGCPEECPPDSKAGVGCAACGPVDNCELVEHGCFKVCDSVNDCSGTNGAFCLDQVCKNVCG